MSRTLPEWIGKTDDEPVPPRVRMRVLLRFDRLCENCGRVIRSGDRWTCDHIIALANAGANRESNLQPLCDWCNPEKNRADVAEKSKTYRMARKHAGIRRPSSFACSRSSPWKKKINGEVVRR